VPTTVADFFPKYHVTALVRCVLPGSGSLQPLGASNHTYGLSLKAQVPSEDPGVPTLEFQTDATKAVFRGLGRVDSNGQPVDYDDYDFAGGDLSCASDEGGGTKMAALIHDYPLGSADALGFQDQNGNPLETQADADYELTEVRDDDDDGDSMF
jgi:hypothetical protein